MTVKQLREELEKYPDNMDVFMAERKTAFAYGLLNSVRSDEITFSEDEYNSHTEAKEDWEEVDEPPKETVVILDEE